MSEQGCDDFLAEGAELLKALAHHDRLNIIYCLLDRECCVGELENLVAVHQPSLSQHLTVLRKAGLVSTRRCSKHIYYHLKNENIKKIFHELREFHQANKANKANKE